MKRIFTMMALAAFTLSIFAQSPDLMSYQAILRDASNDLITNQAVAVKISIMQTTPNSAPVYEEVHSVSTNANGLVTLEIGAGVTSDDFSLIDWANGPYFLKTETDPAGGTNYTISSTTQLLSVPFAKFADEAGNVFSGNYADLAGAPTNVSTFTNDAGYLTTITGGEPAFNGWDKNVADDFSGNYGDLAGAPTNVSFFNNDAGYVTSASGLWTENAGNIYYDGGNVGIGFTDPTYSTFMIYTASNSYSQFQNAASGQNGMNGLRVGIRGGDAEAFIWNYEATNMHLGTNSNFRVTISADGDVGIGTQAPAARLDVNGDAKFGSNGVVFSEIREMTGTTGATGTYTLISLPTGYTMANTRVLAAEVNFGSYAWAGTGSHYRTAPSTLYNLSTFLSGSSVFIYYPDEPEYHSRSYRILIMRID